MSELPQCLGPLGVNPYTKMLGKEESSFFAQGGIEECPDTISSLDRTITLRVENTNLIGVENAILFGYPGQPQDPGVIVSMPDIGSPDQEIMRRDFLANTSLVEGMKMVFATPGAPLFARQRFEPLSIVSNNVTGFSESYIFQTTNGYSPTNFNQLVIDFPFFTLCSTTDVTFIRYPIRAGHVVYFYFTIKKRLDNSKILFDKSPIEESNDPRMSGNPLFDLVQEKEAQEILKSGFKSLTSEIFCPGEKCNPGCEPTVAQIKEAEGAENAENSYAFCPRPTGNDVADTQLFKDANCM